MSFQQAVLIQAESADIDRFIEDCHAAMREDPSHTRRGDWDPENLLEREYDFTLHRRMFEEANAA